MEETYQDVTISLERYEELIRKEALLDMITGEYDLEPCLLRKEKNYA